MALDRILKGMKKRNRLQMPYPKHFILRAIREMPTKLLHHSIPQNTENELVKP
jgi:hypothetical protein